MLLKFCSKFEEFDKSIFFCSSVFFHYSSYTAVLGLGFKRLSMPVVSSVLTYAALASSQKFGNVDSALQDNDGGNKSNSRLLW